MSTELYSSPVGGGNAPFIWLPAAIQLKEKNNKDVENNNW